jgi:hypothetical protein
MKQGVIAALLALLSASAAAYELKCSSEMRGIDRSRCERHERIFAKCGPIKSEGHFTCDRDYLVAHPLECKALIGEDVARCEAEVAAFKACEPRLGREFMRCVREEIKVVPTGRP